MIFRPHFNIALYLAGLIVICDQLSKYWIVNKIMQPEAGIVPVMPHLNLVLVWNKGVTFGLLNDINHEMMTWILVAVAFLILGLLGRWLWNASSTMTAVGLGAVMGGAIGNVIDRLNYGAVVDFLDFYYRDYHWYAFNIADATIVIGVGLLLLDSLVRGR